MCPGIERISSSLQVNCFFLVYNIVVNYVSSLLTLFILGCVSEAKYECIGLGGINDHYKDPWGQPIVYNQPAFQIVLKAFRLGGLVNQCKEYGVMHDAGNAILHWMYNFPALWLRIGSNEFWQSDLLGVHRVEKTEFDDAIMKGTKRQQN